jgi:hypothetical protein
LRVKVAAGAYSTGRGEKSAGTVATTAGGRWGETIMSAQAQRPFGSQAARASRRLAPWWVAPVFGVAALSLVPWVAYLGATLPSTARISERTAWIGFDIGLMGLLALTAVLALRRNARVAQASMATATMVDAWFDIFTSGGGAALTQALQLSVLEVGLAGVCVWISLRASAAARRAAQESNHDMGTASR